MKLKNIGEETLDNYRLTFSKADADVALESNIVAARELESVETGPQRLAISVMCPFAEYRWVSCAAVFVGYYIFVFHIIFHRFSHTIASESTVDC